MGTAMSDPVAPVVLDAIRAAGYHVGHLIGADEDGDAVAHADVIDARTGETFAVNGRDLCSAAAELAGTVGIGLADRQGGHGHKRL